jgi:hypothetical protein
MAAEMDSLSWERLLLHRGLKKGAPDRGALRAHRERFAKMSRRFAEVWLETNRPSRLKDNLRGFDGSLREIDSLLE